LDMDMWSDRDSSEQELQAALEFWRKYHSIDARRRVREAIANYRRYH
jgi:hypothetical protein